MQHHLLIPNGEVVDQHRLIETIRFEALTPFRSKIFLVQMKMKHGITFANQLLF